jgi:predicted GNAT family acetyltransferase
MEPEATVTAAPERSRYEIRLGDELVGVANYVDRDGRRLFTHAEVDPRVGGRGVGTDLVRYALADTEAAGLQPVPICSFVGHVAAALRSG